ncbi:MAG: hypothetical protein WBN39_14130 [Flavobacteriaceae bacterium]|jgi:hypothetical protein
MDVINEILQKSALSEMTKWYKAATLLLFSSIVVMLSVMLVVLLIYGPNLTIQFGY